MKVEMVLHYFPSQKAGVICYRVGVASKESVAIRDDMGRIARTITTPADRREAVALIQGVGSLTQFKMAVRAFAAKLRSDPSEVARFEAQLRDEE